MNASPFLIDHLRKSVIYEVNLRQFSEDGSFASFETHLPRLKQMGVNIIWLMPIHPIGVVNRKGTLGSYYSIKNYYEINPEFGNKEDFHNLVRAIHALDMKVIIDWVANHVACDHDWTHAHPDYFIRNQEGTFLSPNDWTDVIQINHDNENAHDAIREAMCYWINEFDIDGFRADLAHLTPLRFWKKARSLTEVIKPDLIWLAETETISYSEVFDINYAWRWMHLTETFFKENLSIQVLLDLLQLQINEKPDNKFSLLFTSNHDENSWNGTEYEKYGLYAKGLASFSFLFHQSIPLIYSGQEIPIHKRLLFFDKDSIDWNNNNTLGSFYKKLSEIRKEASSLSDFHFIKTDQKIVAFKLGTNEKTIYYFLNLDQKEFSLNSMYVEDNCLLIDKMYDTLVELKNEILIQPGEFIVLKNQ